MPLFEYRCEACGRVVEVMQAFSDPPPAACEACGGPLKKLLSAPAFQFKGSGWYVSDYGRKTSSPPEDGAKAGEKAGETAPATETKPSADTRPSADTKPAASDAASGDKTSG